MWAVFFLVGFAAASAPLHNHHFDREKVFRVTPHNEEQVEFLNTLTSNIKVPEKCMPFTNLNMHMNPKALGLQTTVHRGTPKSVQNSSEVGRALATFSGIRAYFPNPVGRILSVIKVDFWHPDSITQIKPQTRVDFRVEADNSFDVENILEQNGMEYEVLIDNVQALLDTQFDSNIRSTGHSYNKYNNWEMIAAWTADMAAQNPDLVSRSVIGNTFEGRPMYLLKVGKSGHNKKAIFIDCGFHAREWISPAFCQWFVKEAVETYGKDELMTRLLTNLDFFVLPVLNIDGYVYTWTKNRMWRKTRSKHAGSSCIGTDPNRNFDAAWCTVGASKRPCDDTYCGSAPESEKETKALADFIRKHLSTIKAYLTIHSYSQMLLFPYSYTYDQAKNSNELDALAGAAIKELATLYGTKYIYGPGASTIYPAAGGSDDWAYNQGIKYSFTFELRDTGRYGFLLPESQIVATCEETTLAVKYIADYVLGHLY